MTDPITLTDAERDELADACDAGFGYGEVWIRFLRNGNESMLLPAVESIVTARLAEVWDEVKMARVLVDTRAGDFEAGELQDDHAGTVEALVKSKVEGGEVKCTPTATKSSGEVVDLLAALQKSIAAAKESRGKAPTAKHEHERGQS